MGISFDTIPSNVAASAVFVEQKPEKRTTAGMVIPQKILVLGTVNAGFTPAFNVPEKITSIADAYSKYGRGSLLARMIEKAINNAGGVDVYALPVEEADGATAAEAEITVDSAATSAGTLALYVGGHRVAVAVKKGDTVSTIASAISTAINANVDLPVTATVSSDTVTLTAKCKGTAGNMKVEKDLSSGDVNMEPTGAALSLENLTGGATDPAIETALANLGDDFFTVIACPWNDATTTTALKEAGDNRAAPGVKKPFVAAIGFTGTYAEYIAYLADLNCQWLSVIPVEGASSPIAEIASAYAGEIGNSADKDPARPIKTLPLRGIVAGSAVNWIYAQKDAVVKLGGCWTKRDASGVVIIGDCITTYKRNALSIEDAKDTYRYVTTILKMQAKIYSLDVLFSSDPFDRAIIISDGQVSNKRYAISPATVKAFLVQLVDSLWIANAWSKDRDAVVNGIQVEIDPANSSRINCYVPDVMSAELAIVGVQYAWSFTSAE